MARKKGSQNVRTGEIESYLLDSLEAHPLIPTTVLMAAVIQQFGLGATQARHHINAAREKRKALQGSAPGWHEAQEQYLQAQLSHKQELLGLIHEASLEGDRKARLQALRLLQDVEANLLRFAPTERFGNQSEILAAKTAHLQAPPPF
jgi:hypothetical protein